MLAQFSKEKTGVKMNKKSNSVLFTPSTFNFYVFNNVFFLFLETLLINSILLTLAVLIKYIFLSVIQSKRELSDLVCNRHSLFQNKVKNSEVLLYYHFIRKIE